MGQDPGWEEGKHKGGAEVGEKTTQGGMTCWGTVGH